jgi:glucan phosphorylase
MMNGALTIGPRDRATGEMAESRGWSSPYEYYRNDPETRAALDWIFSGHFNPKEHGVFELLRETLLTSGDFYMHLADLRSYSEAHERLGQLQENFQATGPSVSIRTRDMERGSFSYGIGIQKGAVHECGITNQDFSRR